LRTSTLRIFSTIQCLVREIGAEIKSIAQTKVPTLIKYAAENPYLVEANKVFAMQDKAKPHPLQPTQWLELLAYDANGENLVLAALLFRFGQNDFEEYLREVQR